MTLRFPATVDAELFLADYWQRRPLFLPAALADALPAMSADELAGLACEDSVESRLVMRNADEWRVEHGPFDEKTFARLPDSGWTLLVQDVDKFVPSVRRLLDAFDFLPRWRIDDVMVSYAAPGGSVGPHVDEYDVFLIQGSGTRAWETGRGKNVLPDQPLRVLADFVSDRRRTLATGDALYLPPGLPHYGCGDDASMTYSVGFRSPALAELIMARAEHRAAVSSGRYRDPGIAIDESRGAAISRRAVDRAIELLGDAAGETVDEAVVWFGSLVTENKVWLQPAAAETALDLERFVARSSRHRLLKNPGVRAAHSAFPDAGMLFVDGAAHALTVADTQLAQQICLGRPIDVAGAGANVDLLYELYRDGKLYWPDDD